MEPNERGCYVAERCCLPLLGPPSQDEQGPQTIESAEIDAGLYSAAKGFTTEILQNAWKILLHRYIYTETITFVFVTNQPLEDGSPHVNNKSKEWMPQGSLRQFHNASLDTLERRHLDAILPLSLDYFRLAEVNTAIQVCRPATDGVLQQQAQLKPMTSLSYKGVMYDFDLILNLTLAEQGYQLSLCYNCATLSRDYAQAIVQTFRTILRDVVGHVDGISARFGQISEEDTLRLAGWNSRLPKEEMSCVHELIRNVAEAEPCAEGVCAWDGSMTYAELNTCSTAVAHHLVRVGVRRGDYVPFAFEKSLWAVVATLAILKAGAAFVPLDPSYPPTRLKEILDSTGARFVVTSRSLQDSFQKPECQVIVVSADIVQEYAAADNSNIFLPISSPSDSAWVLFTSGSTGKPKGMIHYHRGICSHALAHGAAMDYSGARVLQFSAYTFDVAFIDIFTTLLFGGCVCIPSEEDRVNNIAQVINDMRVNYALLTPSFASLLEPREVPNLRVLAFAGECLTQGTVDRWADRCRLINAYGPAEVGICVVKNIDPHKTPAGTVGYPLPNSSCWLVHPQDHDQLVPIGAVGELLVAGPSLARGYLKNEVATRRSFIVNPAWACTMGLGGVTLYKTGDLLRYNIESFDGSLDFIGRKDTQLKLRGQRIEAGEVEHHLANLPEVLISMVTKPEKGAFAGELVTVVQMQGSLQAGNQPIEVDLPQSQVLWISIAKQLKDCVPKYMIPTTCLVVKRLPLNSSCKLDRKVVDQWLAQCESRPVSRQKFDDAHSTASVPCQSEPSAIAINNLIVKMVSEKDCNWANKVHGHDLAIDSVGLDSIQLVRFSMELEKVFQVKVPVAQLLSSGITIRDIARIIDLKSESSANLTSKAYGAEILQERTNCGIGLMESIESQTSSSAPLSRGRISNVLLTGASGYLGMGILKTLLQDPALRVIAHMRCSCEFDGMQKLIVKARRGGWWQADFASRLEVWRGDLSKPALGLSDDAVRRMRGLSPKGSEIHAIIHSGAVVHYHSSYESLKPTNVSSTLELLRITAEAACLSTFVYVSGGRMPSVVTESELSSIEHAAATNGYGKSKLVAEMVIQQCMEHKLFRNKVLRIIRPGFIIGTPNHGIALQTDYIWRFLAGCIHLKAYNRDQERQWLFISDVDRVAQLTVDAVLDADSSAAPICQIFDGVLFRELWALVMDNFGYVMHPLPYKDWLERLRSAIATQRESHVLFPFIHNLENDGISFDPQTIPQSRGSKSVKQAIIFNMQQLIDAGYLPPRPPPTA